jgi:hypothetical protein
VGEFKDGTTVGRLPPCLFTEAFFRLTVERLATFQESRRATWVVSRSSLDRSVRE